MVALRSALDYLDAADLAAHIDLRDYAAQYLGAGRAHGKYVTYRNPFNPGDTKPDFTIYADGYKEFGDGGGEYGSTIDFVMRLHRLEFGAALRHMADYIGGAPALRTAPRLAEHHRTEHAAPAESWQAIAAAECKRAAAYLWSDAADARRVLAYLHDVRGLTDATIRVAGLGYNPASGNDFTWRKTTYIKDDGKAAYMPPGILIPWHIGGALWAIRVRCRVGNLAEALGISPDKNKDGDELAKYLSFAGSRQSGALYNGDAVQPGRDVLFTEGEFDALLADQQLKAAGVTNIAVVTLGSASNHLSEQWRNTIASNAGRVVLALDNDGAGGKARDALAAALAGHVRLQTATLPDGCKDITDYVVTFGGDVAALLATAEDAPHPGVSDGIRAAALNCKLDAGLQVYDLIVQAGLQKLDAPTLWKANAELGTGLSRNAISRGLKQATYVFISKTVGESSYKEGMTDDSSHDFEINQSRCGRLPDRYEVLPVAAITENLRARLWYRLIEGAFKLRGAQVLLPELDADLLKGVESDDPAALFDELKTILAPAYQMQDEAKARARLKAVRAAYRKLRDGLNSTHCTPLPPGPRNAAVFLRAIHEADPRPRSATELALITGRRPGNVKAVIERAGLENRERAPEVIPLPSLENVRRQACLAAKGRGKVYEVIALREDRQVAACAFGSADMQGWAEAQAARGATLAVKLHVPCEQVVGGDVRASVKRVRSSRSPSAIAPRRERYTGPGYDPAYQRDFFLVSLCRVKPYRVLNDRLQNRETGELLPIPGLQGLVDLIKPEAIDAGRLSGREPDVCPGPQATDAAPPVQIIPDLAAELGGALKIEAKPRPPTFLEMLAANGSLTWEQEHRYAARQAQGVYP